MLSQGQQSVLTEVAAGRNVFFTGSAGTGKSHTLQALRRAHTGAHMTAMTGVAAVHVGGTTLHKFAGIGLARGTVDEIMPRIPRAAREAWRAATLLVVDEVSMLSAALFDKIEEVARRVRRDNAPFGGLQVVLCGDFYQLPPIEPGALLFQSDRFRATIQSVVVLSQQFRQREPELIALLTAIREGVCGDAECAALRALAREVPTVDGIAPTRLFSRNVDVDSANAAELARIVGSEQVYAASDTGRRESLASCLWPDRLALRVGAQVMLLKNLTDTLVNGSRGVVTAMMVASVRVHFATGETETIARAAWSSEDSTGRVVATRQQVPLRLAWCLTVHKSQGMSIDRLEVDISNVFAQGMAYVALSRARTREGLCVRAFRAETIRADPRVREWHAQYAPGVHSIEADADPATLATEAALRALAL